MDTYLCDLCHETVPRDDLERARAQRIGDRVICRACNQAMGSSEEPGAHPAEKGSPAPDSVGRPQLAPRAATRSGSGVAIALSVASTLLTVVAVVLLLIRGERTADHWEALFTDTSEELGELRQREIGTRGYMITRAGEVAEEVLGRELERLAILERQVGEVRGAIFAPASVEEEPSLDHPFPEPDSGLLTAGDAMARIGELEEQILFLQARLFDLLQEADSAPEEGELPPSPEPSPLPTGELGELVEKLKHEDPIERVEALFALSGIDDPGIVRHLIVVLDDHDSYIRALAARILERMGARSSVQTLIVTLDDPDSIVRECAIGALRTITGEQLLFDPLAPREERLRAQERWLGWWKENWKGFLYEEK
jgi:hypothetical protein